MFLTRISVGHPVFATMIMVALMVFGVFSYSRLPVEQMPDVDFPVVVVMTTFDGASPESVESEVTEPIEEAVNTVSGLDSIQSNSFAGRSVVIVIFNLEVDSNTAAQDVRDKLATIGAQLPSNADAPQVLRFDPNAQPMLSFAISSSTLSNTQLTTLAEDTIIPRLQIISGVGQATLVGGIPRQVDILVDPDRLNAFGVSMGEVLQALQQDNIDMPAGTIDDGASVRQVQVEGRIENLSEFNDIIVARRGGQPVRLADVATVTDGQADATSMALLNNTRALAVDVVKIQGANTVGVAEEIRHTLEELQASDLPEGVSIDIVRDNSIVVEQSFHTTQSTLLEGAALAIVIVFVFLNSWRSTVITAFTLPISLIGTITVLYALGFTLNTMTLLALTLSIGMVIDDAIVVRENITRHLHMGKSHVQAALDGTNEIGLAVLATTLSIVAVFLPVAFMEGILGRFFLQFGVTVSVAVLISLFVSFTLDPMMSSVWYDPASEPNPKRGPIGKLVHQFERLMEWIASGYKGVLRWCLRHRIITMLFAIAAFVGSFFLLPNVGVEFVPTTDNGELSVEIETPIGSSLDYTAIKANQMTDIIREFPEVETTYVTIGSGSSASSNTASILIKLVDVEARERTPTDLTQPIREALLQVPGVDYTVGVASGLGGVTKPIQVNLYGDDLDTLSGLADELAARMGEIDGLSDIGISLQQAQPTLGIQVDRERASDLNVSMNTIGQTLQPMLGGAEVSEWTSPNGDSFEVVVRLPEELRQQPDVIGSLPIIQQGSNGTSVVRLDEVATVTESFGASQIDRMDLTRQVLVDANVSGTVGNAVTLVQAAIDGMDLPQGYRISMGGDAEQLADMGSAAGTALLLAVVFIYLVLASQFGSFLQPFAIMMTLPLSLIGVIVGLMVADSTLNMMSAIGFIMLMGLVVKNGILLVDNANQHHRAGQNLYDSIVEAGVTRFRPILMTTLAMVFGMLPLALALHPGSEANASMAHAVIGGLVSSTLLTLVVVPVMLTYLDQLGRFVSRFTPKAPEHGHAAIEQDPWTALPPPIPAE
jgi:hydrophobic/amphiphilic exporter-1 (mainly G- bacteria), HAE1 family